MPRRRVTSCCRRNASVKAGKNGRADDSRAPEQKMRPHGGATSGRWLRPVPKHFELPFTATAVVLSLWCTDGRGRRGTTIRVRAVAGSVTAGTPAYRSANVGDEVTRRDARDAGSSGWVWQETGGERACSVRDLFAKSRRPHSASRPGKMALDRSDHPPLAVHLPKSRSQASRKPSAPRPPAVRDDSEDDDGDDDDGDER